MGEWSALKEAVRRRDWPAAQASARGLAVEWRAVQGFIEAVGADAGPFDGAVQELVVAVEADPVDPRRIEEAMAVLGAAFEHE